LTLGLKIAEGREAEVYAWDGGAVLKLYRPGYLGHVAEASALATLESSEVAPRPIGTVEMDGRHGLILERIDGSDMLTLLERKPWRLLGLARVLAEVHVLVSSVQAPTDLPDLKQTLAMRIEAGVKSPELRDFALRVLERLPAGDRLCHGDLHPGNVLVASGRARVIDWANAARGVREADHARTLLLLQRADPLPGTSRLFRGLMSAGRDVYARAYASTYRRRSQTSFGQVRSWTIVHAAARLAEGIEVEGPKLLAFLDGARRRATG
jgi:aminoglycoside phosphotransferase (APT) family kinase protein